MGDQALDFEFWLSVTDAATNQAIDLTEYGAYAVSGYDPDGKLDKNIMTGTHFKLRHGEKVSIKDIPVGTRVTVTERRGVYTTSWTMVDGKKQTVKPADGPKDTEGFSMTGESTVGYAIDGAAGVYENPQYTLTATNTLEPGSPTGIDDRTDAYMAVTLMGLLVLAVVLGRRRDFLRRCAPAPSGREPSGGSKDNDLTGR